MLTRARDNFDKETSRTKMFQSPRRQEMNNKTFQLMYRIISKKKKKKIQYSNMVSINNVIFYVKRPLLWRNLISGPDAGK